MTRDQLEARLRATEIALDCLLAEVDELRDRLEALGDSPPPGDRRSGNGKCNVTRPQKGDRGSGHDRSRS